MGNYILDNLNTMPYYSPFYYSSYGYASRYYDYTSPYYSSAYYKRYVDPVYDRYSVYSPYRGYSSYSAYLDAKYATPAPVTYVSPARTEVVYSSPVKREVVAYDYSPSTAYTYASPVRTVRTEYV